ncbi:MAG: zinc-binding dehydrogenase [Bifidobacterium sp.]|uniref:Zinc-binding dehydrogenase n=2 Tax=Bifidobacterium TaxID=1678 RepID=A0AB39UF74_9BIFI
MSSSQINHVGVYYGPDDIRVEAREIPRIREDEALVATSSTALCAGEAMPWYHKDPHGKVLGHEVIGTIAQVGSHVSEFHVGDRIFAHHHVPRLISHQALRGHFTIDPHYRETHFNPGAMADYFVIGPRQIHGDTFIIPETISDDEAVTIEPWSCVVSGLKVSGIQPGDTVLVIGAGFMGLGFAAIAPLFGAGRVIVSDLNPWRRQKALEIGANAVIDPRREDAAEQLRSLNEGLLADVVVAAVPNVEVFREARRLVEPGGTIHLAAPGHPNTQWSQDAAETYFSEVTITSRYSSDHTDVYQYLRWLKAGRVNPNPAITHHFPLSRLAEAFRLLSTADRSLKIVLRPDHLYEGA